MIYMSLTRKMLKAMGIEDEKIDQIIEAHSETVDALKERSADFEKNAQELEKNAQELEKAKKELTEAKAALEASGKDPYKVKYEAVKEEFEKFKTEQQAAAAHSSKLNAYRTLLKKAGVSENRIESVLKVSDIDGIEIDDKGEAKDSEKLIEGIKTEWADFITTQQTKGASTSTPPANQNIDFDALSDDEYYKLIQKKG